MKKGIGTPENRELAFRIFKLFGGRNIPRVLGRLEWKHGLKISRQTLYEWKTEGDWEGRLAGAVNTKGDEGILTFNERMLKSVLGLIEKYERHFETGGALKDAQAAYAYTNLVRAAIELSRRMNRWETENPVEFDTAAPPGGRGRCA